MATYGLIELLAFLPGKLQMVFMGLFFLGQGALGPVDPNIVPSKADIVIQNNSYYEYQLAKSLGDKTLAYGYIGRLDVCSQNFMETDVGRNVKNLSFSDLVKTLTQEEKAITEMKEMLEKRMNLSAQDVYGLFQGHLEFAYTNYLPTMSEKNFIVAYYPKTDASHLAFQKALKQILNLGKNQIKESSSRIYKMWSFPSPSGEQILAHFQDEKPFYILTFSKEVFEAFLKDYRDKPKKSLYESLNKRKIIKKMGRGSFFGLYLSFKDIAESKELEKSFGKKAGELYKKFGIESFILSDSFNENVYKNKTELIYDSRYKSILTQLEPIGLTPSDLSWVSDDTRFFSAITVKNINQAPDLLGKLIKTVGSNHEFNEYNEEMEEVKSELGIDIKEAFKLLSGKVFFSITGETFFLENNLSVLDDMDEYLGFNIVKRMVFGASITSQLKFQEMLETLFKNNHFRGKTPIVERKDIAPSCYKVMFNFDNDFPISLYWVYLNDKVMFTFTEENMRKLVLSSSRSAYPFVNFIGTDNLKSNYLSYVWHDNAFFAHQLAFLYEVYLGQLRQSELDQGGTKQYTKYLPIFRNIAQSMGQGLSYSKMNSDGIVSESLSADGISFGNMATPFMGGFLSGLMFYPMSMPMGSKKEEAPSVREVQPHNDSSHQPETMPDSTRSEP